MPEFLSLGGSEFCRRCFEILSIIFVGRGLKFCRCNFPFLSVCRCAGNTLCNGSFDSVVVVVVAVGVTVTVVVMCTVVLATSQSL